MTWKRGSADGANSAIYLPQISRTLVDQLDFHLRTFNLTAADKADQPVKQSVAKRPAAAPSEDCASLLRSDQLENNLLCIEQAARMMASLVEQAGSVDEREKLGISLAQVENKLGVFERAFETMSDELREARRDAEEQRCRALVAESRLENLVSAVTKMIAPLGRRNSFDPDRISPTPDDSSSGYGERA